MRRASWAVAAGLILLSNGSTPVLAQPRASVPLDYLPALKGDYFPLDSVAAKHRYHIYVRLPEAYEKEPDRRYPIVYLLDGDSAFPMLAPHHLFLTYDDKLPDAIIVGIAYGSFAKPINRRHIDFMPPGPGIMPADAGAAAFQQFLKTELLPHVERRFRADPGRRILVAQSRGGAFALYSAFADPDLFWARIASNPSMEPGQEIFFGRSPRAQGKDLHFILASGTEEEKARRQAAIRWSDHWQGRADAPWRVKRMDIPGGTHAADPGNVYRASLRWLFQAPAAGNGGKR